MSLFAPKTKRLPAILAVAALSAIGAAYLLNCGGGGAGAAGVISGGGDDSASVSGYNAVEIESAGAYPSGGGAAFANPSNATTTFNMPGNDVAVTAVYEAVYTVTVSGGAGAAGGGVYAEGARVNITAGAAPAGQVLVNWVSESGGVSFNNENSAATWFNMPGNDVAVTAVFDWKSVTIGGMRWMAENLNVQTASGSWCYKDSADNCAKYGRLYDWATAMTVCPAGWHLPSNAEWGTLFDYAGGSSVAGKKLKSTSGWNNWSDGNNGSSGNGTNDYGFSALPGGTRDANGSFRGAGGWGYWWTATESGADFAYRLFILGSGVVYDGDTYKENGFAVRCVED